ncbi:MAG TPA: carboxypeptidase-like regulatory domain-containing protein, partial [Algoriphagus sp.]|nr:carboxypeptidase-like regulatory domain-containing protein [Algoriphagus sp.]
MNRFIVKKFLIVILFGITFFGFQRIGYSQESSTEFLVTGKVNDPQGKKAIGAAILVKGTTIGTTTDTTGFFILKVPSDQAVLVISHYSTSKSMEVPLNGSKKIVVRLGEGT